jgi:PAS domain S-box-containing protein
MIGFMMTSPICGMPRRSTAPTCGSSSRWTGSTAPFRGTDELDRMTSEVLKAALEIFACDRAWLVYPCDPRAATWRAIMEHTRPEFPGAFALGEELPTDPEVAAVFEAAQAAPGPVLSGSCYDLKIPASVASPFSIRSQIAMAIDAKGDKRHLFGLHQCSRPRLWTPEEQRLFQEIGRRLGDAIAALSMLRDLRDSERKLDAAQRIAHVGWWERDFVTKRVSLPDETQRIFGVPPVDLPQWQDRWVGLIHPEDRAGAGEAAAAAMRGGPRYDVEYRIVRPDGRSAWSTARATWPGTGPGQPVRKFGVMQDITELRRLKKELRASEARFRTFVDHATDAFFLHDDDLLIVDVNRQACESLGYSREELIGMHPRDFDRRGSTSLAHAAGAAGRRRRGGHLRDAAPAQGRHRLPGRDSCRHVSAGRTSAFGCPSARDVSDRKLTEERMRAKEDALQVARTELARVVARDDDGRADRLDRPRSQPASGSNGRECGRVCTLAGGAAGRDREDAQSTRQHRRRWQARRRSHRAHPRAGEARGAAQGRAGHATRRFATWWP